MPIFRINKDLHYFAHVPKCGGTSIDNYLTRRFGKMALNETYGNVLSRPIKWNLTSSQHIPVYALDRLFPSDWFASSFAMVRNPLGRLISAFFYAKKNNHCSASTEFNAWVQGAVPRIKTDPFDMDGHLLPQSAFVPVNARIFHFEAGFEQVIPYLDGLCGNQDGPRQIAARNVGTWRTATEASVPTVETLALIARVYAEDFARFGYAAPTDPAEASTAAALPVVAATGKPPQPTRASIGKRIERFLIRKARM